MGFSNLATFLFGIGCGAGLTIWFLFNGLQTLFYKLLILAYLNPAFATQLSQLLLTLWTLIASMFPYLPFLI